MRVRSQPEPRLLFSEVLLLEVHEVLKSLHLFLHVTKLFLMLALGCRAFGFLDLLERSLSSLPK